MTGKSIRWRVAIIALIATSFLGIGASPAPAAYLHPEVTDSFGVLEDPFNAGFEDLAFDQTRQRLYLLRSDIYHCCNGEDPEQPPRGIYALDMSIPGSHPPVGGNFPARIFAPLYNRAIAVDETEGNIYYADIQDGLYNETLLGTLYGFDSTGAPLGGNYPLILNHRGSEAAVDPFGYLWLDNHKYSPEGVHLGTGFVNGDDMVFDRFTGDLWAYGVDSMFVRRTLDSDYTHIDARFFGNSFENRGGSAFDAKHGVVYLTPNYAQEIKAFSESGELIETFATGSNIRDIAVNEATGEVYVLGGGGFNHPDLIGVYGGVIVPDVETGPPAIGGIGHTEATVTGQVGPADGPGVTECELQYARATDLNEVQKVTITGATGGTFKLAYSYGGGTFYTGSIPFNGSAGIVEERIEGVAGVGNVSVSSPDGGPYTIEFVNDLAHADVRQITQAPSELTPPGTPFQSETVREGGGTNWDTASSAPCEPAASPGSPITAETAVEAELTGLETGVQYLYRLVASNENGTNIGALREVIPQPSLVKTGDASEIQRTAAILNGTVDPEGIPTTFYFEYGRTEDYGQLTSAQPGVDVGTTSPGDQPVSASASGLEPGQIYHYRLVAVNGKGTSYGVDRTFVAADAVKGLSTDPADPVDRLTATLNGTLDPDGLGTDYYFEWGKTKRYGSTSAAPPGDAVADTAPGGQQVSFPVTGLETETTYHFRLVASNETYGTTFGEDRTFTTLPSIKDIVTDPATDMVPRGATLHGKLDPDGFDTTYYFQWGKSKFYGHTTVSPPGDDVGTSAPGSLSLSASLEDLEPGTTYHFRLIGVNETGMTAGADQVFSTPQAPAIEGVSSDKVTANSAELKAKINPNDAETTYRFEYGTTLQYGSTIPVPDGVLPASGSGQEVAVQIEGLQTVTYYFRLVTESEWGVTTSENQTFDFNPPSCPNAAVRQLTRAAYLPDCRAYELVSPPRLGGAYLFYDAPTSPTAIDHFAFTGAINAIPGTGDPPNGGGGDLYVSTRTSGGWVTRYVGLAGNETFGQGGVPSEPLVSGNGTIIANADLSRFLAWRYVEDSAISIGPGSYAPYVWDAQGNLLGRLPSNHEDVPGALDPVESGGFVGDTRSSADFNHYVFSSLGTVFAPGGKATIPGSVYDNNTLDDTVTVVSKTAAGADIPLDASSGSEDEYIRIPAVSDDGSHILMSTAAAGETTHLYMRVDRAVSFDISVGPDSLNHGVRFEGMSRAGSVVYFTAAAQMTLDDHDSSIDLFRWEENGGSPQVTRLSVGGEGYGESDNCNPTWIQACGVEVVPTDDRLYFANIRRHKIDTAIAVDSGDVYFYSPEPLDGSRGTPGDRNLYVWRGGDVQFVAALSPGAAGAAERINVSPDGAHMAFSTRTRITAYDNAGHLEMYSYDPQARKVKCVSCKPDGSPPTSDVEGSYNGIFQTYDGRVFFSTRDSLTKRDSNGVTDVYEYVDGRPQLISTGTGDNEGDLEERIVGLMGVSADGTNAFFSTFETLVGQDESGPFIKYYNARVGGGFPFNKPAAPCAAADECHGPPSQPPAPRQFGSGANLGAIGNVVNEPAKKKKKAKKKANRHKAKKKRGAKNRGKGGQRGTAR